MTIADCRAQASLNSVLLQYPSSSFSGQGNLYWVNLHNNASQQVTYTECKYGGPLCRRPGRVMKVRLVRPRCFVLTMLPLKSLASWTG